MNLDVGQREAPKCYFTHTTLSHVDGANPPVKKEPFRTILDQPYSDQISLLLSASQKQEEFERKLLSLQYARVYMKPLDLLTGEFFNSYIKSGDITMLSEGRSGSDTVISLAEGILRIECDKPTYEKLGLEGKAVGSEGRKHVKARFGKFKHSHSIPPRLQAHTMKHRVN
jgi:ribonuclease P/MRP protein subunit RPP40